MGFEPPVGSIATPVTPTLGLFVRCGYRFLSSRAAGATLLLTFMADHYEVKSDVRHSGASTRVNVNSWCCHFVGGHTSLGNWSRASHEALRKMRHPTS